MLLVFILLPISFFIVSFAVFISSMNADLQPTLQVSVLHYCGSNVFRSVTVILCLRYMLPVVLCVRYMFPVVRTRFITTCWFQISQLLFGLVFSPEDESRPLFETLSVSAQ
jgi:hypothetical protein